MNKVDLSGKRGFHGRGNKLGRLVWGYVWLILFRPSLRPMHPWRCWLLRRFGATVGSSVRISPSARFWAPWNLVVGENSGIGDHVDCYCVERVTIGDNVVVSQYSYLCAATHGYTDPKFPLLPKAITICDGVWLAADVFVGPGVTIGEGAVVGARSSVFRDLPEWMVATGAPAKPMRRRIMIVE